MNTKQGSLLSVCSTLVVAVACHSAASAQTLPFIINEYNAVGSEKYLDTDNYSGTAVSARAEKQDLYFATIAELQIPAGSPEGVAQGTADGRIQGNGDDWIELVITTDHADLRGWSLEWSEDYDADYSISGLGGRRGGFIHFEEVDAWSDLRAGTILTISEEKSIWIDTDYTGSDRNLTYGISEENGGDYKLQLKTDLSFNPVQDDWWIHVSTEDEANEETPLITTSESNIDGGDFSPPADSEFKSGDFSVTNDDWEVSIIDNTGTVVLGPFGEAYGPGTPWGGAKVSSNEVARLQMDPTGEVASLTSAYEDGETSTFGQPNVWNDLGDTQDFTALRSWFTGSVDGDYNGDGVVDQADYTLWRNTLGSTTNLAADGNGDNVVNVADYLYWKARFGDGFSALGASAGLVAVPEPATSLMAVAALLSLGSIVRVRRR